MKQSKNNPYSFELPFRPNYEMWSTCAYVCGIAGNWLFSFTQSLPYEPTIVMTCVATGTVIKTLPPALALNRRRKKFLERKPNFLSFEQLLKKLKGHSNEMWIGTGFEWQPYHAQMASQISSSEYSSHIPQGWIRKFFGKNKTKSFIGQPWIHGLGIEDKPIYQDLKHAEGHTLIVGTTGAGKSQPLSAKVLTPNGFVSMKNVHIGLKVITPLGSTAEIIGIFPQGWQDVYRITFDSGEFAESSADHLWKFCSTDENFRIMELSKLRSLMSEKIEIFIPQVFFDSDFKIFKSIHLRKILRIERVRREECQCIYINSKEHLYITDNYIVTHNTRLFDIMISEAIAREESVIIIDPKGDKELAENARRACNYLGHQERFVYFNPAFPDKSFCIDPLRNFSRTTEIASRISALMPSDSGGGSTFKAFSWQALNNIVQGMLICRRRPQLMSIKHYLESGSAGLVCATIEAYVKTVVSDADSKYFSFFSRIEKQKIEQRALSWKNFYRDELSEKYPSSDIEGLLSMYEHDLTHFSKMVAGLLPIMNMLTSGELGRLLSPDVSDRNENRLILDTSKIINSSCVAYFGLDSLTDGMVGSAIGSLILSDLTAVAGDRYNYGLDNRPVNVFVDEAAEVINEPFIQLLNKGRGAKLRLYVATQTFADFAARLGSKDKAIQVLGNVNNIYSLRVTDVETQTYITDKIPKTRIKSITHSQSQQSSPEQPIMHSGSQSQMLKEEEADLFAPALLGQLPNLEYLANMSGGRIVKGRIPILTDNKEK